MKDAAEIQSNGDDAACRAGSERKLLRAIRDLFSSMKTAIALLLLLALVSIAGTIIPQNAAPETYVRQYGEAGYNLFRTLRLTDMYHSGWYALLIGLISANLVVCSIRRFGLAWRRTYRPKIAVRPDQIANMQISENIACARDAEDAASKASITLKAGSYRVLTDRSAGDVYLYAMKGRLGVWGPYLTHLSILVIFIGAVLGNRLGFEGFTSITESERVSEYYPKGSTEPKSLGFDVELSEFTIQHDAKHNPTGYKSELSIYDGGKPAAKKVIDVNHPLTYRGVSFFQADYGVAGIVLKITAPDGKVVRIPFDIETRDAEGWKEYMPELAPKQFDADGKRWAVFVHDFAPDYTGTPEINASWLPINPAALAFINEDFPRLKTAWTRLGWVARNMPADHKGYRIEMEKAVDFTILQVARNPALPIVYIGFVLILVGVFSSLYVTPKVIRLSISPTEDGASVAIGAMSRAERMVFEQDFARIREALG